MIRMQIAIERCCFFVYFLSVTASLFFFSMSQQFQRDLTLNFNDLSTSSANADCAKNTRALKKTAKALFNFALVFRPWYFAIYLPVFETEDAEIVLFKWIFHFFLNLHLLNIIQFGRIIFTTPPLGHSHLSTFRR